MIRRDFDSIWFRFNLLWFDLIWFDLIRFDLICHNSTWFQSSRIIIYLILFYSIWFDLIRSDLNWFDYHSIDLTQGVWDCADSRARASQTRSPFQSLYVCTHRPCPAPRRWIITIADPHGSDSQPRRPCALVFLSPFQANLVPHDLMAIETRCRASVGSRCSSMRWMVLPPPN